MSEKDDLLAQAQKLFDEEKYQEVIDLLRDEVLDKEKSAELYALKGRSYIGTEDNDYAVFYSNKAIATDSTYAAAYRIRGTAFHNKNEYEKVLEDYNKAIELAPKDAIAYTNRGIYWRNMKEHEKSIRDYNKAIEVDPYYENAFINRAVYWLDKKQEDKAIEDFNRAIEINPKFSLAFYLRGIFRANEQQYDLALLDINNAIKFNPKYANAFYVRGNIWQDKKEYDKAIDDYSKAIELNPKYDSAFNNRGISWVEKGDFVRALSDYNTAIELNPNEASFYRNRGLLYEFNIKDDRLALNDFDKAIELDNESNKDIAYNRDGLLEKLKEQKKIESAKKTIKNLKDTERLQQKNLQVLAVKEKFEEQKEVPIPDIPLDKLRDELDEIVKTVIKFSTSGTRETTVHYTKLFVADKILARDPKIESEKHGKLRYYNAIYMNDPAEGDYIFECFDETKKKKIKTAFEEGKKKNETSVYLGSFLTNNETEKHEDELVMWRTYGKDEKLTEAAGCSMIIGKDFFDEHDEAKLMEQSDGSKIKTDEALPSQGLYQVIYYKNEKYENADEEIKEAMSSLQDILMKMIAIQEKSEKEVQELIDGIIFKRLSRICYLFKSSDYAFEHEVRVIQYMPLGTEMIQTDESTPPKLYVPSNKPLLPYLKKIYIGPKAENAEHWHTYLDFRIRRLEKTDNKEYDVQVQRSVCRFR